MLFVCHPKVLHKHCFQFLLGVKMALTETENNAFCKIMGLQTKSIMVCYGIFWSGQLALLLTIITNTVSFGSVPGQWLNKSSWSSKIKQGK